MNDKGKPSNNSPDNTSTKNNESSSSDNENDSNKKPIHKHEKQVKFSEHLHPNLETESVGSYGSGIGTSRTLC